MSGFRPRALPLAAAFLLAAAGCSSSAGKASPSSPASATSVAPSTPAAAAGPQIAISNFAFSPVNLTVHPGQTVTVTNRDAAAHTLTSTTGAVFDTGTIKPGATGTLTAPGKAGSYPYFCSIHQFMRGTLTVD